MYTSLRGAGLDNLTEKAFYYRHYINIHFMEEEAGYSEQLSQRHFLSRKVPKQDLNFFKIYFTYQPQFPPSLPSTYFPVPPLPHLLLREGIANQVEEGPSVCPLY